MARGLGGLQRLLPRRGGRPPSDPPLAARESEPDENELGPPPVLRPAAIFRQPLFHAIEFTPAWLTSRSAPAPAATPAPTPAAVEAVAQAPAKRTRRPKAATGTSKPATTVRTRPRTTRPA